jgi:hypothetical protein
MHDEPESNERNVRVTLLKSLRSLGASSFFLRSVAGYDMTDAPRSLRNSTLAGGIALTVLAKLQEDSAGEFPQFVAQSLKLLLLLCDDPLTAPALLARMRSSSDFFTIQRDLLASESCAPAAIGAYLAVLARHVADPRAAGGLHDTLRELVGIVPFGEHRHRVVLVHEFIDRIDDSRSSTGIARGLFEIVEALVRRTEAVPQIGSDSWRQFVLHTLGALPRIGAAPVADFLARAALRAFPLSRGSIATAVFAALRAVHEKGLIDARISLWALVSRLAERPTDEAAVFAAAAEDLMLDRPVLRITVCGAVERMIAAANPDLIAPLIQRVLGLCMLHQPTDLQMFQLHAILNCIAVAAGQSPILRAKLAAERTVARVARLELLWRSLEMTLARPPVGKRDFNHAETAVKAIQIMTLLWGEYAEQSSVEKQLVDFFAYYTAEFAKIWENAEMVPLGTDVNPGAVKFWVAFGGLARIAPRVIGQFPEIKDQMEAALKRLADGNEISARLSMKFSKRMEAVKKDIAALKLLATMAERKGSTQDYL